MTIVKVVLRLKRTIVPSVLIRMRRYLGCAVIYEKNMELQMQKVRRPFNILILYISVFDFFFNHVHGGDSNDAVLSSEYLVYLYMQRLAVVQVYQQSYHVSDSKITYHY